MAGFGTFTLNAYRPNGTGVGNARVRILNGAYEDVTALLFGVASGITTSDGNVFKFLTSTDRLPVGQIYVIQVIAEGFTLWQHFTGIDFYGDGTFTANLTPGPPSEDYIITEPAGQYLSSMVPIITTVETPNDFEWEIITATVTHPDNSASTIQAPVEKATQLATLDIRNRIRLGVRPLLVPGSALTREDTDFSSPVEVSFSAISSEVDVTIETTFTRHAAHTLPPVGKKDLADYTASTNRRWIVPAEPVIAFRGFYRDVSLWLPDDGEGGTYDYTVTYYNAAGGQVATESATLEPSDYVQRIRINTDPHPLAVKAILSVLSGASAITKPLTVLYRD